VIFHFYDLQRRGGEDMAEGRQWENGIRRGGKAEVW